MPNIVIAAFALALASVAPAFAQQSLDALAEELVALRGEVESLNAELNRVQEQHRAEMNSLAAQKGDLEATVRRDELRVRQLEQDLEENRVRARAAGAAGEALLPVALQVIADLQAQIERSFPFKRDDRLTALAEIRSQAESGALSPPQALNRLWRLYEDELRLTRDNGLYSQVIPLGGNRVLADIAKVGAVALYFQTRDGRSGYVTGGPGDWAFTVAESSAERDRIDTLFDSLKKQIRTGYFELPNGTIATGGQGAGS
ncbi:MAG: DUF3450 family protein [Wenzhouxiangellaceae bacterium]|nr:DUF3450 family protein [Wenzhouxiangellaceae bacterium]